MSSEDSHDYQLSRIIDAHKDDVKAVQSTSEGLIISGGHDHCFRFWARKGGEFSEISSFPQKPSVHVNSLGYFEGNGEWRLFVGRRDGTITVYGPGSTAEKPLHTLVFHEQNVACLFIDEKQELVMTGSWDKTCVVFSIKEMDNESPQILRIIGQAQILAVHSLPEKDLYLTAGSDKAIRLWKKDTEIRQFAGHKDVVRALLVRSNEQFISASNDSTIRIWDIESGACIEKISSNFDFYIYSLTSLGDKLATTSEGGYIEIWEPHSENKLLFRNRQIIKTPSQSIWDACVMLNGDLVTAGSDGRIYVWTTNEKRKAPQAIIEALDAALAAQTAKEAELAEKQAGGKVVIKVALDDGAPSLELIYEKGTDPSIAAEKFIRDNDLPISYLSEITEYIKANIPEARAAAAAKMKPQETQRVEVDGEKWDYAFDISVDDGRKLRLCYNTGEDVDCAAQRFVEKYNLPMKFLAQISTFLRQQMTEAGATKGYTDPYTGGSSYVPESQTNIGGSGAADPFTGQGRYIPSSSDSTPMDTSSGDPLTSGGRYVPGSADPSFLPNSSRVVDKKKPQNDYCPLTKFYFFGVEQMSQKAKDKLKEVNSTQETFQLNETQIGALEEIMCPNPQSLNVEILISAIELGLQWNIKDILPIVDVFRIALLHKELNQVFCDLKGRGADIHQRLTSLIVSEPSDAVCAVLCRAISNAFAHSWGQEMLMKNVEFTTTVIAQQVLHSKPVVQLAASTALANWAYLLLERSETVAELGPREDLIRVIIKVFENELSFGGKSELALVRLMQAIATLMWGDADVIKLAKQRNIDNIVNRIKDGVVEESSKALARDIIEMLHAVTL